MAKEYWAFKIHTCRCGAIGPIEDFVPCKDCGKHICPACARDHDGHCKKCTKWVRKGAERGQGS